MLTADIKVNGEDIGYIKIVRKESHTKLRSHFYYDYYADDEYDTYEGRVLHNYDNGAYALLRKVTKAIVAQQKERKAKK